MFLKSHIHSLGNWSTVENSNKMHEISTACWVLLDENKRADYDNGSIALNFSEYFQHPEFYRTRPFWMV